jgi:hypothetical protein
LVFAVVAVLVKLLVMKQVVVVEQELQVLTDILDFSVADAVEQDDLLVHLELTVSTMVVEVEDPLGLVVFLLKTADAEAEVVEDITEVQILKQA